MGHAEQENVSAAIEQGWISGTGPCVEKFELALAERIRRGHVVATGNGTMAIELALRALEIGPGDEVIVPAFTFAAPATSVLAVGAIPVIADVSAETWTLSPERVAERLSCRTKAILAVDVLGHPADYDALGEFGIPVLEELRLLTNTDMDAQSPFAGILLGQPTLARKLRLGIFAALDQRIATRYTITPMDLAESAAYLAHHLHLAGRSRRRHRPPAPRRRRAPQKAQQRRHRRAHRRRRRQQATGRRHLRQTRRRRTHPRLTRTPPAAPTRNGRRRFISGPAHQALPNHPHAIMPNHHQTNLPATPPRRTGQDRRRGPHARPLEGVQQAHRALEDRACGGVAARARHQGRHLPADRRRDSN
ncbi:MAG TPA: DegT/DnrJ/EryC1/StrS family aminotransferase [Actinomycetes bacterium]|nr:DegT/DnrJ/EryC1/StrS family aminotransferase [Actinomycetes bacterium]